MKTITQTEYFPGTPAIRIYEALLNGAKHSKMTGGKATGEATVGAKFTAWDGYISGTNLELEPGVKIVQTWQTTEWPEGAEPSQVQWTFADKGGGTEVTLVHSKVPSSQAESYRQGWVDYYWTPMKAYFAA